jgi:hypothetical protein
VTGTAAALAASAPWRDLPVPIVRHLRVVGERDRSALPRWQVRSVITPRADPGAYARCAGWVSREHFLEVVVQLVVNERPDILAKHKISPDTFRRWVWAESLFADWRTGQRIIRRPRTVAKVAEVHERTVQRCRAAGRELGIYVDVMKGRMLRLGEILQCRYRKSPQRGLANESAFRVPRWVARRLASVDNSSTDLRLLVGTATPTSGPPGATFQTSRHCGSLTGQGKKEPTSSAQRWRRRSSAGFKLALAVQKVLPWARNEAPGRLATTLERFAACVYPWSAQDVVQHLTTTNHIRGWTWIAADQVQRPYALLARYFRDDEGRRLDPVEHHPRLGDFLWAERRNAAEAKRRDQLARPGTCKQFGCPTC